MSKHKKLSTRLAGLVSRPLVKEVRALEGALSAFVDAVNATGGVYARSSGLHATVAGERPEDAGEPLVDLGEAYVLACAAIGYAPLIDARLSEKPEHGDTGDQNRTD